MSISLEALHVADISLPILRLTDCLWQKSFSRSVNIHVQQVRISLLNYSPSVISLSSFVNYSLNLQFEILQTLISEFCMITMQIRR
jgi:hypothetical protein